MEYVQCGELFWIRVMTQEHRLQIVPGLYEGSGCTFILWALWSVIHFFPPGRECHCSGRDCLTH